MSKKDKTHDTPATPTPPTPPARSGDGMVHIERHVTHGSATDRPAPSQAAAPDLGLNLDKTFVRKQAAIFLKQVAEHYVLYDPLAQTFLRLNAPAHHIWQTIGDAERRFVPDIKTDIQRAIPEMEEDDIDATLATFIDNGVLTIVTTTQE